HVRPTLEEGVGEAEQIMAQLARLGISIDDVTAQLIAEGVQRFAEDFDKLLAAVARKRAALLGDRLNGQAMRLPAAMQKQVAAELESWRRDGKLRRLWAGDAGVWSGSDEARWL